MSGRIPKSIVDALAEREEAGSLRNLTTSHHGIDLCSNDYLGIARKLARLTPPETAVLEEGLLGATGSRLVSGTRRRHEEVEAFLAEFHQTESALLFGSGYEANLGLLSAIGSRQDTIIYDELVHASMRDGIRLSPARSYSFKHNDLEDLSRKIDQARGDCFVAVESVYSMDGDCAPLCDLCELCEARGAYLVVDEAHGTGIFGKHGEGVVQSEGLQGRVFARVHTFGKALGYRGAVVVGATTLREYLVNFARPFIYSTASDLISLWYVEQAYSMMADARLERESLRALISAYRKWRADFPELEHVESDSPIQAVIIPTNRAVVDAERALSERGIFAKAIRSPTVAAGRERIRLCLHAFNTHEEVANALEVLTALQRRSRAHG